MVSLFHDGNGERHHHLTKKISPINKSISLNGREIRIRKPDFNITPLEFARLWSHICFESKAFCFRLGRKRPLQTAETQGVRVLLRLFRWVVLYTEHNDHYRTVFHGESRAVRPKSCHPHRLVQNYVGGFSKKILCSKNFHRLVE